MWLRMESILGSEDKKKVKKIWRLNLSLVTVTNDKFFFFKMTCNFLFHGWMYMYGIKYAVSILIRCRIGLFGRYDYGTSTTMACVLGVHAVSMVCGRCVFFNVWSTVRWWMSWKCPARPCGWREWFRKASMLHGTFYDSNALDLDCV